MKTTKKLGIAFLLLFTSIFIFSCKSDKLSRDTAELLIKEKFKFPINEIGNIIIKGNHRTGVDEGDFQEAKNLGLLTYSGDRGSLITATITDSLLKYVASGEFAPQGDDFFPERRVNVIIAQQYFKEITGILENKEGNTAEVTFTLTQQITPFGKLRKFSIGNENISFFLTFSKFDDGWRINDRH